MGHSVMSDESVGVHTDSVSGSETEEGRAERAISAACAVLGTLAERNVALATCTTFRIGGPADIVVRPSSIEHLHLVADAMAASGLAGTVIGQGSNLLVGDAGIRGIVVVMGNGFDNIDVEQADDRWIVTAQAGTKLPVLARRMAALAIDGMGWMVGVPGSVGGAVRMNAGGHGSDTARELDHVTTFSLLAERAHRKQVVSARDLRLAYRSSSIGAHTIVTSATFHCASGDAASLDAELSEIVRWRREHQPGGANCGSVFTNPPGQSAGRLIDEAGLRGYRLRTAHVSEKHANFIQADERASAADVWELIIFVRQQIFERYGVMLHPEVQTVGFSADLPLLQ
jgi:UDP-N-acetylmuramate dehydrogenase